MTSSLQSTFTQKQKSMSNEIQGMCSEHNRAFECYSLQANIAICASCLMFGTYKGHEVISLEEANIKLRKELDLALRQGVLKTDNTQGVLLDIRHNILTCDEQKVKVLNETSEKFKQLINTLKERKTDIELLINTIFDKQFEQLKTDEQIWEQKENNCKQLLQYAKSHDDNLIIQNSKQIIENLNELKQDKQFKKVSIINEIDSNFKASNSKDRLQMNHDELIKCLQQHMVLGDQVSMQYRV